MTTVILWCGRKSPIHASVCLPDGVTLGAQSGELWSPRCVIEMASANQEEW
jgi:hypothetical protein